MADEHNKWLNRETAERLLSGESLEAVDAAARDQAERLAEALGALSAEMAPATTELPGEQAALAAFRKSREAAEAERTSNALGAVGANRRPGVPASDLDADVVRIGAPTRSGIRSRRSRHPRWARPARLTLAAAVAAGTLGGVAMAAGSGVLPTPFHHERPAPGASVSADETPGQPLVSPSPRSSGGHGSATATPGGGASGSASGASSDKASGEHKGAKPGTGGDSGSRGTWWREASADCRALRDGKELGNDRKRALENLAGGSARVRSYCKAVLAAGGATSSGGANGGEDNGGKGNGNGGSDDDKGKGDGSGRGDDDGQEGRGHGHGHGHGKVRGHGDDQGHGRHRRSDVAPSPAATALAPAHPGHRGTNRPAPSPSPS
jgi:hypothetical protein